MSRPALKRPPRWEELSPGADLHPDQEFPISVIVRSDPSRVRALEAELRKLESRGFSDPKPMSFETFQTLVSATEIDVQRVVSFLSGRGLVVDNIDLFSRRVLAHGSAAQI